MTRAATTWELRRTRGEGAKTVIAVSQLKLRAAPFLSAPLAGQPVASTEVQLTGRERRGDFEFWTSSRVLRSRQNEGPYTTSSVMYPPKSHPFESSIPNSQLAYDRPHDDGPAVPGMVPGLIELLPPAAVNREMILQQIPCICRKPKPRVLFSSKVAMAKGSSGTVTTFLLPASPRRVARQRAGENVPR